MASISRFLWFRHLRAEPNQHVLHYKNGNLVRQGPGLAYWFNPLSAALVQIPVEDPLLKFLMGEGVLTADKVRIEDDQAHVELFNPSKHGGQSMSWLNGLPSRVMGNTNDGLEYWSGDTPGQQQQLAIARAMIMRPKVLLLDEPTEGIQPNIIQQIARVITYLKGRGDMHPLLALISIFAGIQM